MQKVVYTHDTVQALGQMVSDLCPDRVFVLCDAHTATQCWPRCTLAETTLITIPATDAAKTTESLIQVWAALQQGGATRHSLLINLGGGMVTDLGGFAAATFKRGIRFVNVPTTLLAMVDAAVGGKTGINFGGLKNEVGCFQEAEAVVIDTQFLATLDHANLCSGYAEMLKHSLLRDVDMWASHVRYDLSRPDLELMQTLVRQSVEVKQRVVEEDPHEKGIRKALNLGHTVGHAIESLYLAKAGQPEGGDEVLLHGYAVAWGLVAELYISAVEADFPADQMRQTARFVFDHYGRPAIGCKDYEQLYDYMRHDKKNRGGEINFTLLHGAGSVLIDQHVDRALVDEAIDFLRDA